MCIRDRSFIADEAYDPHYGARPVNRYLQKNVETQIAAMIIKGDIVDGQTIDVYKRQMLGFARMRLSSFMPCFFAIK